MDRLAEFGRAAQQAKSEGTAFEQADNMERGVPPGTAPNEQSPPEDLLNMAKFISQCEEITGNTKRIEQLTDELERQHKAALNTTSETESADITSKIDVITAKVNQYSNKSQNILKAIEVENTELRDIAVEGLGDMRMREVKHRQLATSFVKATKKLSKMQENYREKYKKQVERQYRIVNPTASAEEVAKVVSGEGAQAKIFASAVKEDQKKTLANMQDRCRDVKNIEKSILELHQLFLDMQTMVVEQGDIINRVETNVDNTVGYTEEAAADMKVAVEYQKSIWKKKWIFVILGIVGVIILIMFILYLLRPFFMMRY